MGSSHARQPGASIGHLRIARAEATRTPDLLSLVPAGRDATQGCSPSRTSRIPRWQSGAARDLYFAVGAFLALITVRDGGLELALGAHAANNLFAALILNHVTSSLPTAGVWQIAIFDLSTRSSAR